MRYGRRLTPMIEFVDDTIVETVIPVSDVLSADAPEASEISRASEVSDVPVSSPVTESGIECWIAPRPAPTTVVNAIASPTPVPGPALVIDRLAQILKKSTPMPIPGAFGPRLLQTYLGMVLAALHHIGITLAYHEHLQPEDLYTMLYRRICTDGAPVPAEGETLVFEMIDVTDSEAYALYCAWYSGVEDVS